MTMRQFVDLIRGTYAQSASAHTNYATPPPFIGVMTTKQQTFEMVKNIEINDL